MARTRASVAAKVATGKSSKARCSAAPPPSSTSAGSIGDKSSRNYSGGNTVCPRETPKWQKPITNFFIQNRNQTAESDEEDTAQAGSSKTKPKRHIIHSDDEAEQTDTQTDIPINKELEDTIELEELTGEDSHKMDEYYVTKDKGQGKKSKKDTDKENKDNNVTRNKRHLDELNEEDERNDKKIKLD